MSGRYRIKRVPFLAEDYDSVSHPYGLWDSVERCYVNRYGEPDRDYYAATRGVAIMRRRNLNEYARNTR